MQTRARIIRIAEKLGYVPDPMLSALVARRWAEGPAAFQGTLAWLVRTTTQFDWKKTSFCPRLFEGAFAAAAKVGYHLEAFELGKTFAEARQVGRMLRARSISGVLVCPLPQPETELEFPWEDFSAVALGATLGLPKLHAVETAKFGATVMIMQQLRARGYNRIGLAVGERQDQRAAHHYLGAYLAEQKRNGFRAIINPIPFEKNTSAKFCEWLRVAKPDAIITGDGGLETLELGGVRVPDEVGIACPVVVGYVGRLSGVVDDMERSGRIAVESLVAQIGRGERGVPTTPIRMLIEGHWHEGQSLRPR